MANIGTGKRQTRRLTRKNRGIVIVLFTIGLVAMLAMAGLAMDTGNVMLNNTRLQNALDAAALSGATSLSQNNGNTNAARLSAVAAFSANANAAGSGRLGQAFSSGQIQLSYQFSNSVNPFVPGTTPADYLRVRATGFSVPAGLTGLLGMNDTQISSSAVAGPSPELTEICNIAPVMVCGDPGGGEFFGYTDGQPEVLASGSLGGNFLVGPGNYQLVRLPSNSGNADLRRSLAGSFDNCVNLNDTIETEPGNGVGPVSQGTNTRFGIYSGPLGGTQAEFPPDVIVTQADGSIGGGGNGNGGGNGGGGNGNGNGNGGGSNGNSGGGNNTSSSGLDFDPSTRQIFFNGQPVNSAADLEAAGAYTFNDYRNDISAGNFTNDPDTGSPPGAFGRRTMAVPVGDCSTTTNGQGSVPLLGVLCFHLLQDVEQTGQGNNIFGQFVGGSCGVTGVPGQTPSDGNGPFVIQLYKDSGSSAS